MVEKWAMKDNGAATSSLGFVFCQSLTPSTSPVEGLRRDKEFCSFPTTFPFEDR
jgi:hypothetical protein